MGNTIKTISTIALVFAIILSVIIIIQLIKTLLGGSWDAQDIIVALVILNITISFMIMGHLNHLSKRIHGHIQWHRGRDNEK